MLRLEDPEWVCRLRVTSRGLPHLDFLVLGLFSLLLASAVLLQGTSVVSKICAAWPDESLLEGPALGGGEICW